MNTDVVIFLTVIGALLLSWRNRRAERESLKDDIELLEKRILMLDGQLKIERCNGQILFNKNIQPKYLNDVLCDAVHLLAINCVTR